MIKRRERSYKVMILVADALGITTAYFTAFWASVNLAGKTLSLDAYLNIFPWILVGWLVIFRFAALYNIQLRGVEEFIGLIKGVIIATIITLSFAFFYRPPADSTDSYFLYSRTLSIFMLPFAILSACVFRNLLRWGRQKVFKTTRHFSRLIIVGKNEWGISLAQELSKRDLGYQLVGFVDDNPTLKTDDKLKSSIPVIGSIDDIEKIISEQDINDVWIALPSAPREKLMSLVNLCLKTKVSWKIVPDLYEVMLDWMQIDSLSGIPLIGINRSNITGLNAVIKRGMDIIFSLFFIVILSPLMLITSLLIKITSRGPVFFKQKRIGQNSKRFVFLKFRTMYPRSNRTGHKEFTKDWINGTVAAGENQPGSKPVYKIKNDPRITPIGGFLRKFSLDELPQLFNVLNGDMSLIGPRPPLAYEIEHYQEWHRRRLEARPGITGLWQVSGRNLLPFEEMVKLDIYYIENWSIWLDLKILFKTVFAVVFSRAY